MLFCRRLYCWDLINEEKKNYTSAKSGQRRTVDSPERTYLCFITVTLTVTVYSNKVQKLTLRQDPKVSRNLSESTVVYIHRRQVALSSQTHGEVSHIFLLTVALSGPEIMYSLLSREKLDQVLRSLD